MTHRDLHSFPTRRSSDLKRYVIDGQWALKKCRAGKSDQAQSIGLGQLHEIKGSQLGTRQAVGGNVFRQHALGSIDRKSTRLNSSHTVISYAVFCLKKKKK